MLPILSNISSDIRNSFRDNFDSITTNISYYSIDIALIQKKKKISWFSVQISPMKILNIYYILKLETRQILNIYYILKLHSHNTLLFNRAVIQSSTSSGQGCHKNQFNSLNFSEDKLKFPMKIRCKKYSHNISCIFYGDVPRSHLNLHIFRLNDTFCTFLMHIVTNSDQFLCC